jgi:glycosyltransferase involved in cell wall biosynthesis
MSKTIWFINDYAGSRYHGMEFRNYYFAKEFAKMGYSVYIISASYMHLFKKLPQVEDSYKFENIDGINYLWLKVPKYGESTSKKRVLKWFIFSAKLFALPHSKMQKPDVVIASPMAPFLAVPAYRLAKKYGAKFVYEVKDIWPLSIIELGDISPKHPLIRAMSWCEKFAIKRADVIVSSLFNYGEHLKRDLGIEKSFVWVNNGIDLDEVQNVEPLKKSVKELIPNGKFIIGYTGTIGIANALETLCEAAKLLKDNDEIVFVIVGDGKEKQNLVDTYGNLDNIIFIEPIPKKEVQSMLSLFDVCYIGWNKEKIYNYGISANKIFDYMYSAKPIIHAYSGKGDLVKLAKCGVSVEAKNPKELAKAIEELYSSSEGSRREMGENGKRYVLEQFTYEKLSVKFLDALFKE